MDVIGKTLAAVFGITFMALLIVLVFSTKIDQNAQTYLNNAAEEFVDNACASGYISPGAYQELMNRVGATGNLYNVNIIHQSKTIQPKVKTDSTGKSLVGSDGKAVVETGSYVQSYNTYNLFGTRDSSGALIEKGILDYMFPETGTEYHSYPLKNGDYLQISITLKNPTLGAQLASAVTATPVKTIAITYGGYVGSIEENGIIY